MLADSDDRLDFRLPDFTRIAWASDEARATWEPRFAAIVRAWQAVEWKAAADGVRDCALVRLDEPELLKRARGWIELGLTVEPLQLEGGARRCYQSTVRNAEPGAPTVICAVVGRADKVAAFRRAWKRCDDDRIGALLGYPACCRKFFQQVWVEQNRVDTTWPMAAGSIHADQRTVDVGGSRHANILWRWTGIRMVPHLPCSFDCAATDAFAESLREVAMRAGFAREYQWMDQILDWPVEWSALHGIAEIKTPILKLITRTDATAVKYVVRRRGAGYPQEGSRGVQFPYQIPARRAVVDSRAHQLGLANPIEPGKSAPPWYHRDNGFSSRMIMDRLHQPLLAMARRAGLPPGSRIIDLGCGNGALLASLCGICDGARPFGIDRNEKAIEHARLIHPQSAGDFTRGDFFETAAWPDRRCFDLCILMVGRLAEVPAARARALLSVIAQRCKKLLIYRYPGGDGPSFDDLVRRLGLRPTVTDDRGAGLLLLSATRDRLHAR